MKKLMENWRRFSLNENRASLYRGGMCDAYALAKHEMTGLPIYLVQGKWIDEEWEEEATEPCHMLVGDGKTFYDVDGARTEQDLKQNCYFSGPVTEVEIIQISPREAREIFTVEGVHDEDIEQAKQFIQQQEQGGA